MEQAPSNIIRLLTGDQLQRLRKLLGKTFVALYTPTIDVSPDRVWATHFSIWILGTDEFVCVGSDWSDTREHGLDYHELETHVESWPHGVGKTAGPGGLDVMSDPVCTVHVNEEKAPVETITVRSYSDSCEAESVLYDRGLVIEFADESRLAFAAPHSIRGGLELGWCAEFVTEFEADTDVRVRLVAK